MTAADGMRNEDIARAFSSHDFEAAFPHLSEDIAWTLIGEEQPIRGRQAVAELCRQTAAELEGVTTSFRRFRVFVAEDGVVIDSLAEYVSPDGTSVVASCDLYDFDSGRVTAITSYNIELDAAAP
jgi:ketosteroid isomerase-like protein